MNTAVNFEWKDSMFPEKKLDNKEEKENDWWKNLLENSHKKVINNW